MVLLIVLAAVAASAFGPLASLATSRFAGHELVHLGILLVLAPAIVALAASGNVALQGSRPLVALASYAAVVVATHLPSLDRASLENPPLHLAIHLALLAAAALFWQQVFGPQAHLAPAIRMAILLLATGLHAVVGGIVAFTDRPLYAGYVGLDESERVTDQALGGVLFWIPPKLVFIGVVTLLFFRWLAHEDLERREGTV